MLLVFKFEIYDYISHTIKLQSLKRTRQLKKLWWFAIAHDNWYTCTDAGTAIIVMQSGMQQAARRHWTSSRSYTAYTNGAYVRSGTSLGHIFDRMKALYRCQIQVLGSSCLSWSNCVSEKCKSCNNIVLI